MIDVTVLITTAAYLAFLHTLVGVDHSLPFVVLGKARGWSLRRTLLSIWMREQRSWLW